jgi:hypothetical protein
MTIYIVTEESYANENRIVAVFSTEEAAEEFIYENESDGDDVGFCTEEWPVNGDFDR